MKTISRRQFVRVSALTTAATWAAACTPPTAEPAATAEPMPTTAPPEPTAVPAPPPTSPPPTAEPPEPTAVASRYKEAPILADLVAEGELPPVDERLPENPDVLAPVEMVGKFGGTWRRGFKGVSDRWGPTKLKANNLLWYTLDITLRAALVESWVTSEDASTWTFQLRKGMKWSDGTPFTSEAFHWFYENQVKNGEITAAPPNELSTGETKTLCALEVPDEWTVVFNFAHPNPLFGYTMAGHWYQPFCPGHYMKQFHVDLTHDADALTAAAKDAGFDTWSGYYGDRNAWYLNPDRPSTDPWLATNMLSEEMFVMDRNPYYWQVDPEDQQLPYIDKVTHRLYESADVFNMWILNGEIDCQNRGVGMGNYTLYKENEEKGDYHIVFMTSAGHDAVQLNQTAKEPRLREFFQDRRVRIAVSHAVNRDEVNDLLHDGLGTPRQYGPISMSPNYYPKLANAYIEYDPAAAEALLDEAGYTERDEDGYRLYKDGSGETLSFIIEGTAQSGSSGEDLVLMVASYLGDVGIKTTYKYVERSLYEVHCEANEIDAAWWGGNRTILPIIDPGIYLGTMMGFPWGNAWGIWKTDRDDPNGEEPPEGHWIWDIWNAWDEVATEPDEATRNALFERVLDVWAEELPMIGFLGEFPTPVIVKNDLHNFVGGYPSENALSNEHFLQGQCLFWENPEEHM